MWSLSLQPPPLPLSPSRRNCTCARVGLTRPVGHAGAGHRPSYPSGIRMETAPRPLVAGLNPRASFPCSCQRGAGAGLRGRVGPSITEGRMGGIKIHAAGHSPKLRTKKSDILRISLYYWRSFRADSDEYSPIALGLP